MAKDKKSFLLYCDLIHTVEKLSDKDAGEMFKHILRYVNDQNPTTDNQLIDVLFEQIKQQLKRDLKKYEERAERSRQNGKKGGRPKTQKTQQVNSEPKKPDTDKDTVTVKETDKDIKEMGYLFNFCIQECPTIRQMIERKGWDKQAITDECMQFLDVNYQNGGQPEDVRKHFFNYLRKQQPYKADNKKEFNPYG